MIQDRRDFIALIASLFLVVGASACGQAPPDERPESTAQPLTVLTLGPCSYNSADPFLTADDLVCVCDTQFLQGGHCQALAAHTGRFPGQDGAGLHIFPNGNSFGTVGNDAIRSMKTGANVRTYICVDAGFEGTCTNVRTGSTLNTLTAGSVSPGQKTSDLNANFDRVISSIRVDLIKGGFNGNAAVATDCQAPNFDPPEAYIALYTDGNFGYPGSGFTGDCVMIDSVNLYAGTTGTNGSWSFGVHNDWLSSVRISSPDFGGAPIRLYRDANFQNPCIDISVSAANLGGCNDNTSSLALVR